MSSSGTDKLCKNIEIYISVQKNPVFSVCCFPKTGQNFNVFPPLLVKLSFVHTLVLSIHVDHPLPDKQSIRTMIFLLILNIFDFFFLEKKQDLLFNLRTIATPNILWVCHTDVKPRKVFEFCPSELV
jgi:hypothetical protein